MKELIEYMVDTYTFLLSGAIMVVNLWSSGISGSDVLDLLHIFLVSLAARATTILFFYHLLRRLSLSCDFQNAVITWVAS